MMLGVSSTGLTANLQRRVQNRDSNLTALVRSKAYRLYSILLASPHEIDVDGLVHKEVGIRELRPYDIDLAALCSAFLNAELASRMREYSGLFEVGKAGPPVAIRKQQEFAPAAGTLEDLVRFYSFFGYPLLSRYAWAPDHMSVILEFCHLLCHRESVESGNRLSFQLAQYDFISRHLIEWLPAFADHVEQAQPDSLYARIARSANLFVARDYAWQSSTVSNQQE